MAENTETTEEFFKEKSPFPVMDAGEFTKLTNRNFQVATRAASACFSGAAKFNKELTRFVGARLRKDMEAASALMSSKTSEAAFHAQAEFVENAIRDYADEASKLLHLAADMAQETMEPMESRTEEVLRDLDERSQTAEASRTKAKRAAE